MNLIRFLITLLLTAGPWLTLRAQAEEPNQVDLLLVLAVDCSGSVNDEELALQLGGIAAALRDDAVIAAATSGPRGRVAINLLNWSDAEYEKYSTGWVVISSAASAKAFADRAERFTQRRGGATGIGSAIAHGIGLIEQSGLEAPRRVIDVSGDGIEAWQNTIPKIVLETIHPLRAAAGVTVNGLAIRNDFHLLDRYYRDFVIGGPDAFVMDVASYEDFAVAIRRKLLRELSTATALLK